MQLTKTPSVFRYLIPQIASIAFFVLFFQLVQFGFLSLLFALGIVVPVIINTAARTTVSFHHRKIYLVITNLIFFHGLLYFMTYNTDVGVAALVLFVWNVFVSTIYDVLA